ncbi:Flp family type IVb pilin [Anaerobacillus sp. CMMVII]|uniref:Flp family type IVb pilin n=1 Tax=Anaerobacillus sp. CMMVII TaxID=2755588 RepID=UPI0021B77C10|nr:Flp family type IVb pilin [Anaerobacillus sp. CMMVII]MCT8136519.1 Flp family type IVb pilin [Anaerobacillus sp. CMMVII]
MLNKFKQLVVQEEGQGMTEYGLIIGLIALAAIVGLTAFGKELDTMFNGLVQKFKF